MARAWPNIVALGAIGAGHVAGAIALLAQQNSYGGAALFWPGLAFGSVCLFYVWSPTLGASALGKDPSTGRLHPASLAFFFPFFAVSWLFWSIKHVVLDFFEDPYNEVSDGFWVGRWPRRYPAEFPVEADNVVDLTAEFPARRTVVRERTYLCCPCLDMEMPQARALADFAQRVASLQGRTYVHFANGHGRSALIVAMVCVHAWAHACYMYSYTCVL